MKHSSFAPSMRPLYWCENRQVPGGGCVTGWHPYTQCAFLSPGLGRWLGGRGGALAGDRAAGGQDSPRQNRLLPNAGQNQTLSRPSPCGRTTHFEEAHVMPLGRTAAPWLQVVPGVLQKQQMSVRGLIPATRQAARLRLGRVDAIGSVPDTRHFGFRAGQDLVPGQPDRNRVLPSQTIPHPSCAPAPHPTDPGP